MAHPVPEPAGRLVALRPSADRGSVLPRGREVTDEQISVVVAAAERLRLRQAGRGAGTAGDEAATGRLERLDWAVRAGRLALAGRADRAVTPPGAPAPAPARLRLAR